MTSSSPFYAEPVFWLYLLVAIPYTAFVLLYATRSKWWVSPLGRSLLLSKSVIALLASNAVLGLALGNYPGRDVVRGVIVGSAIVAGWYQLSALIRIQQEERRVKCSVINSYGESS